jgi:uncharacterized protein (TIGR03435 family)
MTSLITKNRQQHITRVWVVAILVVITTTALAQSQSAPPQWEVVSVKPCKADLPPGARGTGDTSPFSPGRLHLECQTASGLIQGAYINSRGAAAVYHTSIEGGPSWINSERYTVNAKAEGTPNLNIMRGPMLQRILENRFKLKVHWVPKEVSIYKLTVAKGGPKLKPFKEGSCIPPASPFDPPPSLAPGQRFCATSPQPAPAGLFGLHFEGRTIDDFVQTFLNGPFAGLEREVSDKTGLTGKFDIELQYSRSLNPRQQNPPEAGDPAGPSIFTALQEQLGLKLESGKGTGYTLVVDSIERPSEN